MKRDDVLQLGAYLVAASLAVGGAFIVSSRFLASVRAQEEAGSTAPATEAPAPAPADGGPSGGSPSGDAPASAGQPPAANAPPAATSENVPPAPPAPESAAQPQAPAATDPSSMPAAPQMQDPYSQSGGSGAFGANSGIAELEGFLEPFIYDIVNRRDPFQAYAEYVPVDMEGPPRALSPAQRWELEQLKLVGIMWDVKDPKAMFLDPEDEVMILGRDESIGNRNGYIAAIREGEVIVVEAIRKRGDIIYRTRVLRIER